MAITSQYSCTSHGSGGCQRPVAGGRLALKQWCMAGPQSFDDEDEPLVDRGRSLPLRLLALLGAFAVLMLGVSSVVVPLLWQPGPAPMPDQRDQGQSASA